VFWVVAYSLKVDPIWYRPKEVKLMQDKQVFPLQMATMIALNEQIIAK
jgi:hypothetical protein